MVRSLTIQRKLNWLADILFLNRNKIKITFFDELNKEQDLRCKIKDNRIQIYNEAQIGNIDANPKIASNAIWDKGPRYIVIAGHNETMNPLETVAQKFKNITTLERLGFAELIQVGVRWERNQGEKRNEDLLKYILIAVGIQIVILLLLAWVGSQELDGLKETLSSLGNSLIEIKNLIAPEVV